jgi:hypothetical protein
MITGFESGMWYRYLGKEREEGWNNIGKMDFCLDNKPHQCNKGDGWNASFFDSLEPNCDWFWTLNLWEEAEPPESPRKKVNLTEKEVEESYKNLINILIK